MKLLARHDPYPALFDAYRATLPALASGHEPLAQGSLRAFELVLLRGIGVLPDLSVVTLTQQPVAAALFYQLVPESGVVAIREEASSLSGRTLLALQGAFDDGAAASLQTACVGATSALRGALRALLHYHLGSGSLRTRQVMQGVQRLVESAPNAAAR